MGNYLEAIQDWCIKNNKELKLRFYNKANGGKRVHLQICTQGGQGIWYQEKQDLLDLALVNALSWCYRYDKIYNRQKKG